MVVAGLYVVFVSLFSLVAFAFCPYVFSISSFALVTYKCIIYLLRSLSLVFRTTMRRNWLGSAADPLWVASTEMGRGGTGRRKTAVDESRKETTDRVAKYQTDYVGRTGLWYAYGRLLRRPRRCFCCASVFLPFPFALGRILFMLLYCFVLSVTSPPGGARHLFFILLRRTRVLYFVVIVR